MALITWKANFDSSWSGATNWDTSTVPTSTDNVRFDSTSVKSCTIDIDATVTDVTVASSYTGNISWQGHKFTCYNYNDDGFGGNRNFGNGINILPQGISNTTFHIGPNLGTVDATSCAVDFIQFAGTRLASALSILDDAYGCVFRSWKIYTQTRLNATGVDTHFRGDGTLLNFNAATGTPDFFINKDLLIEPTSSGTPLSINGGYAARNGTTKIIGYSSGIKLTIPPINFSNSALASKWLFSSRANVDTTFVLNGLIDQRYTTNVEVAICATENNSYVRFDTSNKTIETYNFRVGASNPSAKCEVNFGSSTVRLLNFDGTTYNGPGTTLNFNTSLITNYNLNSSDLNWAYGLDGTVNIGTFTVSQVNSSGTGYFNLTSNNKPFYNISHTGSLDGGVTINDSIYCNNLTLNSARSFDCRGSDITALGNVQIAILASAGTLYNGDSSIIMKGANKTLSYLVSGSFIQVPPYGYMVIDNTGIIVTDENNVNFQALIINPGKSVTFTGGIGSEFVGPNPIRIGVDTTVVADDPVTFRLTDPSGDFNFPAKYSFKGVSGFSYILDTSTQVQKSIPTNYYYSGSGTQFFLGQSGDATWTLSEDYTRSLGGLTIAGGPGNFTFITNNYKIKTNAFTMGCSSPTGKFTSFYGSSLIDCSTYTGATYNSGTIAQNYNTSTILVGTNFTHGSNHNIDPGTSLVKISGTGTLTTAEKPFYDVSSSSNQVVLTGNLSCHNITAQGNFAFTSYRLVSVGDVRFNGVSLFNPGDIYMLGTDPTLLIAGAVSSTACDLIFDCTGNALLTMTYPNTNYGIYGTLSIGPSVHLTHTTAKETSFTSSGISFFLDNNAWYTLNSSYDTTFIYSGTGGNPLSIGTDTTWDGNGPVTLEITGTTVSPALIGGVNYSGTGGWSFNGSGLNYHPRFTLIKDLKLGSAPLKFSNNVGSPANHMDVSTAGYSVTCGSLTIQPSSGAYTYFFASNSNFNVGSFNISVTSNPEMSLYLGQSNWVCDGSWNWGRLEDINVGTSIVTFTGNGGISALTGGSPPAITGRFYNVFQNSPGETRLILSDTSFNNYTLIDGNYDQSGRTTWFLSDASFGGSGNLNFGERISFSKNTANFEIASTIGDVTASSCDMTFTGVYPTIRLNHDATFERLYIPSNVSPTLNGTQTLNLRARTLPLRMDQTATININAPLNLSLLTSGNPLSGVLSPYTITGDSTLSFDSTVASTVVSIPSIAWGQYLSLAMRNNTPGVSNTIQLSGDMTCKNLILNNTNTGTLIFTPQTYGIDAQSISFGGSHSDGTLITDFSSINVRVNDVNPLSYDLGTNNIKFNKSKWTCTGDWVFRSSHNTQHAWDTVTFVGDGTVTSNGEYFNWLYLNNGPYKLVLADNLTCREFKYLSGTLNKNGYNFNIASDYIEIVTTE